MVASVTTIGCSRSTAMKKPLKAPAAAPMAMPPKPHSAILRGSSCMWLASETLTSEMTAAADRSKPPESTTMVCPTAAMASVAPPVAMLENS